MNSSPCVGNSTCTAVAAFNPPLDGYAIHVSRAGKGGNAMPRVPGAVQHESDALQNRDPCPAPDQRRIRGTGRRETKNLIPASETLPYHPARPACYGGALPEASEMRSGMRRLRARDDVPRAPGEPRTPPFGHYEPSARSIAGATWTRSTVGFRHVSAARGVIGARRGIRSKRRRAERRQARMLYARASAMPRGVEPSVRLPALRSPSRRMPGSGGEVR